jgi:hypothetical protein
MSTFEAHLRALLDDQAERELPPSRVSISTAMHRGGKRLRWRRVWMSGPPVLAVAAVLALTLSGTLASSGQPRPDRPAPRHQTTPATPAATAPDQLPVLQSDASFGWLPAGAKFSSGGTSPATAHLNIYTGRQFTWQLTFYARTVCRLAGSQLTCSSGGGIQTYWLDGNAPAVSGHRAYWQAPGPPAGRGHQGVIWQYARGGWAVFGVANAHRQPPATLLKIADGIRFGKQASQPVRFAVQLTAVPRSWQLGSLSYGSVGGVLLAQQEYVAGQRAEHVPFLTVTLSSPSCYFYPGGQSRRAVVAGHRVTVTTIPAADGRLSTHQLCARDVRGLFLFISVLGKPAVTPATLFTHLRVLGADPADWASTPVSEP